MAYLKMYGGRISTVPDNRYWLFKQGEGWQNGITPNSNNGSMSIVNGILRITTAWNSGAGQWFFGNFGKDFSEYINTDKKLYMEGKRNTNNSSDMSIMSQKTSNGYNYQEGMTGVSVSFNNDDIQTLGYELNKLTNTFKYIAFRTHSSDSNVSSADIYNIYII